MSKIDLLYLKNNQENLRKMNIFPIIKYNLYNIYNQQMYCQIILNPLKNIFYFKTSGNFIQILQFSTVLSCEI